MTDRPTLDALAPQFDLIIIGGGITGAGIAREAVRTGASVLLVEQNDFASGTSSRSSKLVHGGLRYLKSGQWRLTLESVRERQRLMREAPGLIHPQTFLMPIYRGAKPGRWLMQIGLWIYDFMAGNFSSRWVDASTLSALEPQVRRAELLGAMQYIDAGTDDARMVLRLILDACAEGAIALNYASVVGLINDNGRVGGVKLRDAVRGDQRDVGARMVMNATGAWASLLPQAPSGAPKLRPLRGSHFVFPRARLPIQHAVSWLHPGDSRPIFAYPWEGAVVYGTTDFDHADQLDAARMTPIESAYLIEGLAHQFPDLGLRESDAVATYAGVRPVVAGDKVVDPSAESRESAMWSSPGIVSITGGKLTTFRGTARHALREASKQFAKLEPGRALPVFSGAGDTGDARLSGRLGASAQRLVNDTPREEQKVIEGTPYTWAEIRWAARHEKVVHLQDLMLRRTRLGLTTRDGGAALLSRIGAICREELRWDDAKWAQEERDYRALWQAQHAPVIA